MKTYHVRKWMRLFCITALIVGSCLSVFGQNVKPTPYSRLANQFYTLAGRQLVWANNATQYELFRSSLLTILDSAAYQGLVKEDYHYTALKKPSNLSEPAQQAATDRQFTDALLTYCRDLYQGRGIDKLVSSDEVSGKYAQADEDYLLAKLLSVGSVADMNSLIASIEPNDDAYRALKKEIAAQLMAGDLKKIKQLGASLNLYRWMYHFRFDRFIAVNIPSATLQYYEHNSSKLEMKVVVGKPSTRSPRFSTWCYQVILYPYWNVPASIGRKELLPMVKRSPSVLKSMNLQVINSRGAEVRAGSIDWSKYNRGNFPYTFRQCTGCDNSLGVIKFNLTDPFNVYLHDTNHKLAFLSASRYLSHGCIRLEQPIELGNFILDQSLDSAFLKACYKNQKPVTIEIERRVPVFVVYMPVSATEDTVRYHKDIYRLF